MTKLWHFFVCFTALIGATLMGLYIISHIPLG